jgi:hypothetical protein
VVLWRRLDSEHGQSWKPPPSGQMIPVQNYPRRVTDTADEEQGARRVYTSRDDNCTDVTLAWSGRRRRDDDMGISSEYADTTSTSSYPTSEDSEAVFDEMVTSYGWTSQHK